MTLRQSILIFILLSICKLATACSCAGSDVDINHINAHSHWLKGIVIERTVVEEVVYDYIVEEVYKYKVAIQEVYKGNIDTTHIDIFTAVQSSACGVYYEVSNEPIYLFLSSYKGRFATGMCSLNTFEKNIGEYYKTLIADFTQEKNRVWKDRFEVLTAKGRLKNNKPQGRWMEIHVRRYTIEKGKYKRGERHGKWKIYDKGTEELIRKIKYKHGVRLVS